jgi:hypothetical protein
MKRTYMERFASRVETIDELALNVAAALSEHLGPDESVRLIVVAPRQKRLGEHEVWQLGRRALLHWILAPAWVLLVTPRGLIVVTITQPSAAPLVTVIPTAALVWIEIGSVLLKGWLECAWVDNQQMHCMRIHFNTVGDLLFRQVLRCL